MKGVTMTTRMFQMKKPGRRDALQAAENAGRTFWSFWKDSLIVLRHVWMYLDHGAREYAQ